MSLPTKLPIPHAPSLRELLEANATAFEARANEFAVKQLHDDGPRCWLVEAREFLEAAEFIRLLLSAADGLSSRRPATASPSPVTGIRLP